MEFRKFHREPVLQNGFSEYAPNNLTYRSASLVGRNKRVIPPTIGLPILIHISPIILDGLFAVRRKDSVTNMLLNSFSKRI
jgi:hypothetical protein